MKVQECKIYEGIETVFPDLIAMNALYRPGPIAYIPSFQAKNKKRLFMTLMPAKNY
jgi:DNA polymerase III alpha subunit